MKLTFSHLLALVFILLAASCSRKKDKFLNRNYHAVTTEFNVLYNGGLALEQGMQQVRETYQDNFWEILPIERFQVKPDQLMPGQKPENTNFELAEEKAIKAIQKHTMEFGNNEVNPQIDEAYILLGKSRYYDLRFIPALDAFNYILAKHPTSNNIDNARIWKERTNIKLGNDELAIKNLKAIFNEVKMKPQELADANGTIAQAYLNLNQTDSMLVHLKEAARYTKKNEERGRYYFILGQVYNRLQQNDSAAAYFDRVIGLNRKIPRRYLINAQIEKFRLNPANHYLPEEHLETLQELAEYWENKAFKDRVYNYTAEYYLERENLDSAVVYFNRSLRTGSRDAVLNARNYSTLAEINFDGGEYETAGKYYDSTLIHLVPKTEEHRLTQKKRKNLDDVIFYEGVITTNDSILKVAAMSDDERLAFFEEYIQRLKEQARLDSIAQLEKEKQPAQITPTSSAPVSMLGTTASSRNDEIPSFYFYNPQTVLQGAQRFKQKWGVRENVDNWRRSANSSNNRQELADGDESSQQDDATIETPPINPDYDPQTYLAQIPDDQTVLDSLAESRNNAYFQLGIIYKEKFKRLDLSQQHFEQLLTYNPAERIKIPGKFYLYQVYQETQQTELANSLKNDILSNHSESIYAEYIRNPDALKNRKPDELQKQYYALYKKFEAGAYKTVIEEAKNTADKYKGEEIVPKFEMLKVMAESKLYGISSYKTGLSKIAKDYPNSEEGERCKTILDSEIRNLESKQYVKSTAKEVEFLVIYPFQDTDEVGILEFSEKLKNAFEILESQGLYVSIDPYNESESFVVVHGLKSMQGASGFADIVESHEQLKLEHEHFEIGVENYAVLQLHKNKSEYLNNYYK